MTSRLSTICWRLVHHRDDLRHELLDVCDELIELTSDASQFPRALRGEVQDLCRELQDVQPRFRSHRQTSVLFDRQAAGELGKRKARDVAQRVIALSKAVGETGTQ